MLRIVSTNPSQMEHVQLAAVNPPLRISAKTARLHFEMTRPSMTVSASWRLVTKIPRKIDEAMDYWVRIIDFLVPYPRLSVIENLRRRAK